MIMRVIAGIIGVALLAVLARSLARDLLVPRPASSILTRSTRTVLQGATSIIARTGWEYSRQHRVLSGLGPMVVLGVLFGAAAGFLVAYALIIYAVAGVGPTEAFLQAGSALMTLGIVQVDDPAQIAVTLLAAFTGMVIIAMLVGYLLLLFTAYNSREAGVTKSTMWAGEPPWGPELICRRHLSHSGPMKPLEEGWIDWVCQLRVSHTMYPPLTYFRSAGFLRDWVCTLIARLDAATLEIAIVSERNPGDLSALLAEGAQTFSVLRHLVENSARLRASDASDHFPELTAEVLDPRSSALYRAIRADGNRAALHRMRVPDATSELVTRAEFDRACDMMAAAGVPLRPDRDAGWERFQGLRQGYESNAYRVAERVHAVPAPWTGPRRRPMDTIWPTPAVEFLPDSSQQ